MDISLSNYRTAGAPTKVAHIISEVADDIVSGLSTMQRKATVSVAGVQTLLDALEEQECVSAYDRAKAANEELVPFDILLAELEQMP